MSTSTNSTARALKFPALYASIGGARGEPELMAKVRANEGGREVAAITLSGHTQDEAKPRDFAELFAEAGTVANETGLTPRQLAEQRAELLKACKELHKQARGLWNELVSQGYAEEDCPLPCGFEMARAAIARAESRA